MTLEYENECENSSARLPGDLNAEDTAFRVLEGGLDFLGCPYECRISLTLTDSGQIREINRRFRKIDQTTDVLSFPMQIFPMEGDFSFLEQEEQWDAFDPETGELLLGDIVINRDRVISQAEEYGHSILREYAFLLVHSLLHLTGYDHMEPEEARRMEEKQEEILHGLGITRV